MVLGRKGNILDTIVIMLIIFMLACGMMFFIYLQKNVTNGLKASSIIMDTPASATIVNNVDNNASWVIDFFVVMLMFSLPLLGMILSFFNNISPVWCVRLE